MKRDTRYVLTLNGEDDMTTETEVLDDLIGWGFETADEAVDKIGDVDCHIWEITVTVKKVKR